MYWGNTAKHIRCSINIFLLLDFYGWKNFKNENFYLKGLEKRVLFDPNESIYFSCWMETWPLIQDPILKNIELKKTTKNRSYIPLENWKLNFFCHGQRYFYSPKGRYIFLKEKKKISYRILTPSGCLDGLSSIFFFSYIKKKKYCPIQLVYSPHSYIALIPNRQTYKY